MIKPGIGEITVLNCDVLLWANNGATQRMTPRPAKKGIAEELAENEQVPWRFGINGRSFIARTPLACLTGASLFEGHARVRRFLAYRVARAFASPPAHEVAPSSRGGIDRDGRKGCAIPR